MNILMADDDKDDFLILQEAAAHAAQPVAVSYAANWIELWRSLLKTLPDILFLDLNMPVKDGFECLQTLRSDRKFDELPVVIYSTSVNKADIDKAYRYGANYFIIKPNSLDAIAGMLSRLKEMDKSLLIDTPERENFVIV